MNGKYCVSILCVIQNCVILLFMTKCCVHYILIIDWMFAKTVEKIKQWAGVYNVNIYTSLFLICATKYSTFWMYYTSL